MEEAKQQKEERRKKNTKRWRIKRTIDVKKSGKFRMRRKKQ